MIEWRKFEKQEITVKRNWLRRQIALMVAIAVILSLFVAVALIVTMSGCSTPGVVASPTITSPAPAQTSTVPPTPMASTSDASSETETVPTTLFSNFPTTKRVHSVKTIKTTTTTTTTTTVRTTPKPIALKTPGAVAITFDDGPGGHTARLLDALAEYNIKVTFFVLGQSVERSPGLIRRMQAEGHQVANHSYSHKYLSQVDEATRANELKKTSDAIEALTGYRPSIMRPPGGYRSEAVYEEAKKQGMATVFWDVDTADWKYKDSDYVYNYLLNHTSKGRLILMHDIHKTTVDGFIRALPRLIEHGFTFVTVDELVHLEPGDVYPTYWRR